MSYQTSDTFTPETKGKDFKLQDEWLEFDEPVIISVIGQRGGGKSGLSDHMLEQYYNEHFTCLHLWSARSLENLYPIVNKNCGIHFRKIKQLIKNRTKKNEKDRPSRLTPSEEDFYSRIAERGGFIKIKNDRILCTEQGHKLITNQLLHCKCEKAIPILLLVPDYIDFDQESIDRFNGFYWKNVEEYKLQYQIEITKEDKELLLQNKLLKPKHLQPKPLIKIMYFQVPTTETRKEKFREEWTKSVLIGRDEHRIIVMSPLFFEGADKFDTLAEIATFHPTLMYNSGHFDRQTEKTIGKPYKYWSLKQRNWHKMAVFIDEARSVIPSSKMHGEKGAGVSKKAIFDKVPEMRQFKTWLFLFYQNPTDVYDGVRVQDNMTIIKRSTLGLASDYWKWIFTRIELDRYGFMKKLTNGQCDEPKKLKWYEEKYPYLKHWIDQRRPRIEELPSDKAYVIRYGKIKLISNGMGSWHHKQEMESITGDTGIKWKINRNKRPIDEPKSKKEEKLQSKKKKNMSKTVFDRMRYLKEVEKKDWFAILDDLIILENEGQVEGFGFQAIKDKGEGNKWCSDRYRQLKKRFESISQ